MAVRKSMAKWEVQRQIPVTLLVAMVAYFAAGVAWITITDTRLDYVEWKLMDIPQVLERITKIESNLGHHQETLARIERYLERNE